MQSSYPLVVAVLALALAACGAEAEPKDKERRHGAPPGFELAMLVTGELGDARVVDLSVDEVAQELATGAIRLIDIRTEQEVADGGTIPGAEHIPMDRLDASVLSSDDGREVVLYCRSGARSLAAATRLTEESGQPVSHMTGGILSWRAREVRLAEACEKAEGQSC